MDSTAFMVSAICFLIAVLAYHVWLWSIKFPHPNSEYAKYEMLRRMSEDDIQPGCCEKGSAPGSATSAEDAALVAARHASPPHPPSDDRVEIELQQQ